VLGKVLGWLTLALVIWWIVTHPHEAGTDVHNIGTFISTAFS
jgi:hypothetical protein